MPANLGPISSIVVKFFENQFTDYKFTRQIISMFRTYALTILHCQLIDVSIYIGKLFTQIGKLSVAGQYAHPSEVIPGSIKIYQIRARPKAYNVDIQALSITQLGGGAEKEAASTKGRQRRLYEHCLQETRTMDEEDSRDDEGT